MIPVSNLLALLSKISFASLISRDILKSSYSMNTRVCWVAAAGSMAAQGWTVAAGSGTKPKNVKGEYATLRVCQQSSEDS